MDIWNEPITYKKGAAYLGAGFTIKPIFDDHIGALRAIDPKTGKIVWEYKNKAPLWGGVLTTAGDLVFCRHARRLPEGGRRQDRQGAVEVQDRLRRRRLADHLGAGRRAVRRRRLRLGRRGAAVGRRGRQVRQGPQPGRHGLGVQAAQGSGGGRQALIVRGDACRRGSAKCRPLRICAAGRLPLRQVASRLTRLYYQITRLCSPSRDTRRAARLTPSTHSPRRTRSDRNNKREAMSMIYAQPGTAGAILSLKPRYGNFIGGEFVAPVKGQYFTNTSPVNGEADRRIPALQCRRHRAGAGRRACRRRRLGPHLGAGPLATCC